MATGAARSSPSPSRASTPRRPYELIKFLTSPASEAYVFKNTGNLPSQPKLLKSEPVQDFKNPFFSNAPVGKIFANSALELKPQILGPHQGDIQTAATNATQRVEQSKQSATRPGSSSSRTSKASPSPPGDVPLAGAVTRSGITAPGEAPS